MIHLLTTNRRRLPIVGNARRGFFQALERFDQRAHRPGVIQWEGVAVAVAYVVGIAAAAALYAVIIILFAEAA